MIGHTVALARLRATGVIPVVRADAAEEAEGIVTALAEGGLYVFEITLTVPNAPALIAKLSRRYGDKALVGAGSVNDEAAARECIQAGARFVVSPVLDLPTLDTCKRAGVVTMPGALTPTEIATAWKAGADLVKVFPVSALGGASYVRSLRAPLPGIPLVPTGGIALEDVARHIDAGAVAVGAGSELADPRAIRRGQPERISEAAQAWRTAVRAARGPTASPPS